MTDQEKVVEQLIKLSYHICFAESCTAGLAAGRLVDVPSASTVLDVSFVTYANQAKITYAGVDPDTIDRYGVVSEQVAGQMAKGCAAQSGAQVGVGISGLAGPGGGSPELPVGTVCFGFWIDGVLYTETQHFGSEPGRNGVRRLSVDLVFDRLKTLLGQLLLTKDTQA